HYQIADYLERRDDAAMRNSVVAAIADHYRRSAQLVNEMGSVAGVDRATVLVKALKWVQVAGDRALESDPPSADAWFTAGHELASDDETRARMLYGRAQARLEVGHLRTAREDLDLLDRYATTDPLLKAQTLLVRGNLERRSRNHTVGAAMLREAADRMAALGEPVEQALALRLLGLAELERSDHDLARRALEASQRIAASIGDERSEAWAYQSLAWQAFRTGRVDEAAEFADQANELFTSLDDLGGLTWTRGVMGWVLFHTGRLREAEAVVAEVLPETMRRGDPWAEGIIQILNASIHLWAGRPQRALAAAQHALTAAARADDVNLAVQARAVQGRAHISLADVEDGLLSLEQAYALAEHQGDADARRLAAAANCAAAARIGDPSGVMQWAGRYETVHSRPDAVGESEIVASVALGFLQQGRVGDALSEITLADTKVPSTRVARSAVSALIHVATGDFDGAIEHIDRALAGEGTYLDVFRARIALAGLYFRQGRTAEAKSTFDHAMVELGITGDRVTAPKGALFSGVCGFDSLDVSEQRYRSLGLDPAGWVKAFRSVAGYEESLTPGG
ncbi:MAG: tetratricopeptide repeat protein, partial [Acidimicrobiales bacterium]|nr:tetratricopeptide repeat protein [Acidimicrobiales bacterium]